jgi:hypothetical protein
MKPTLKSQDGMSLVEATIILLVLMLLTGVLAPSIWDFVNDAMDVKVKEDCEAIGVSVVRLTRDVGSCLKFDGSGRCTMANRVDILYSGGPDVKHHDVVSPDFNAAGDIQQSLNWYSENTRGDSMEHQFVTNDSGPMYPTPAETGGSMRSGPQFLLGWRGAYLSPGIGPDPWGHRYLVNSVFLSTATDACADNCNGGRNGGWINDTFCISAGRNGLYETAFAGNSHGGVTLKGDDFIFVISGGTR